MLRPFAERTGAPDPVAALANVHAYALTRMGRLGQALEILDPLRSLTDLLPVTEAVVAVGHAYVFLYSGRPEECAAWCQRVEAIAAPRHDWNSLLFLWDVLGWRHLREGRARQAADVYAKLESTVKRLGIGEPCLPPWARHGITAYIAAGRLDDATRVVDWLERSVARLACRFPRIAATTGRAQLAECRGDHAAAEGSYVAALGLHYEVDLPLERVETLLGYGAFLRRTGHPSRARPLLAEALDVAEASGAGWLTALAQEELKVAGGRRRRRGEPGHLTPQEQRVAELVATGASNPEIARQLYLSVSTVETHLERVYAKLGIHSRRELMARGSGRPTGGEAANK
jgi:DNA-binding CsgD family transcriptional regulator